MAKKREESARYGARPGFEERLSRAAPGKAKSALLYLPSFGASPAEAAEVIDRVAGKTEASTYYPRLPGHGTTPEQHARFGFVDHVVAAEQGFAAARKIGERVVVVGSGSGALLATWLAAQHPGEGGPHALVLASPLYAFADRSASLLGLPGGGPLLRLARGEGYAVGWSRDPERRRQPGYENFWPRRAEWPALVTLDELRRLVARDAVLARVKVPVLLIRSARDASAGVGAMEHAFAHFASDPKSRVVTIDDGDHVLMSAYVRSAKPPVIEAVTAFLNDVLPRQDPVSADRAPPSAAVPPSSAAVPSSPGAAPSAATPRAR